MKELIRAALFSAPFSTLTYKRPDYLPAEEFTIGRRVIVPLGNGLRLGAVVGFTDEAPADVKLKQVLWPGEKQNLIDPAHVELVRELGRRYSSTPGQVFYNTLPAGLRSTKIRFRVSAQGFPGFITPADIGRMPAKQLERLAGLWRTGLMEVEKDYLRRERETRLCLAKDPPWPVRPNALRQVEVLEYLFDRGPTKRKVLVSALGPGAGQAVSTLVKNGLIAEAESDEDRELPGCDPEVRQEMVPTPEQAKALDEMLAALKDEKAGVKLLFGVTGSGKTLVYLKLAEACLEMGRSVMLLAPEVALAVNLWSAARRFLPRRQVYLYHGYRTPAAREAVFRAAAGSEDPVLVVGTRSALFLPVTDTGLIVLDEEHDTSFKQEERMPYQAKEVAYFRAKQSRGLLVLGSATPDVKTYHAAKTGHFPCIELVERVGAGSLPEISLVDLRTEKIKGVLARPCLDHLNRALDEGDQAIILLNRRGYAPLVFCPDCGQTAKCPDCHVGLTYHKARERLVCHYCGLARPFPMVCDNCGGAHFIPMGEGTEKLEESLVSLLPERTGVLRLDRDSTRRVGRMEEILTDFARGKAQVLVGTQMLSKGHHFPGVTVVIVADADLGLNLPDFRAAERTFQLLVQVAGRAGRGEKPGRVYIQTRNPEHYCWKYVMENDYQGFFERELDLRRRFLYPPFIKLGLVRLSYPVDWDKGESRVREAAQVLKSRAGEYGVRVLGPAPAPIGQIKKQKRFHCLLKAEDWLSIRSLYAHAARLGGARSKLSVSLDLDPVNML